ncbi:MAG: hypothetical protein EBT41_12340 [Betaproteobacteria bacterium]|nr:hypothetical protein [Betaproteobacteria bacterium]
MSLTPSPDPATRDPAWLGRVFWTSVLAVLLMPTFYAVEFKPWVFLEPQNLKVTANFLGDFFPPVFQSEFLLLLLKDAWLGFVGAGGLGQQMDASMKMFNGGEVATILMVLMILVAMADQISSWMRRAVQ